MTMRFITSLALYKLAGDNKTLKMALHLFLVGKLQDQMMQPGCQKEDIFKEIVSQLKKALDSNSLPERVKQNVLKTMDSCQQYGPDFADFSLMDSHQNGKELIQNRALLSI